MRERLTPKDKGRIKKPAANSKPDEAEVRVLVDHLIHGAKRKS
jgi:hypothetical protein